MKKSAYALIAGALLTATAAEAGVITLGSPKATSCWAAAERNSDQRRYVDICTEALADDALGLEARAGTHVNRGIIHMRRFEYERAAADFAKAREIDPDQAEAYLNEGILAFHQSKTDRAIKYISKSLELKTDRPHIAYFVRGLTHEDRGEARAAYRDLRMAVNLAPEWQMPARELARYQVR